MQTRTCLFALTIFAFGFFMTGCDSGGSDDTNGGSSSELIPLETDNSWTFEVEDEGESRTVVLNAARSETVNGTRHYVVTGSGLEEFFLHNLYVSSVEDGVSIDNLEDYENEEDLENSLLLKYPVEEGESYSHTDESGRNTYRITANREEVEVPAGTFNTWRYHIEVMNNGEVDYGAYFYFAPGVGPVQVVGAWINRATLVSHSLQ